MSHTTAPSSPSMKVGDLVRQKPNVVSLARPATPLSAIGTVVERENTTSVTYRVLVAWSHGEIKEHVSYQLEVISDAG